LAINQKRFGQNVKIQRGELKRDLDGVGGCGHIAGEANLTAGAVADETSIP
jgi:hypothetical protein